MSVVSKELCVIIRLHQQLLLMLLPLMILWSSGDWQMTCEYVVVNWFIVISKTSTVRQVHACSVAICYLQLLNRITLVAAYRNMQAIFFSKRNTVKPIKLSNMKMLDLKDP